MTDLVKGYLESFTLEEHGDAREQKWWPLVKPDFPSYEVFWRFYIVPLTNRVDSRVSRSDPQWIRVRPSVPDFYVPMMMAHYSVFYCVGRASEHLSLHPKIQYAEDVVYLLQSAGENLKRFLREVIDIAKNAGTNLALPCPDQFPKGFDAVFEEVKDYRDTLLHYPVLGRASDVAREYLPSHSELDNVRKLWRNAETLSKAELVDSTVLVNRLCRETKAALERIWASLLNVNGLEQSKTWDKMASTTGLYTVPLAESGAEQGSFYSPAASGTFFFPQKP